MNKHRRLRKRTILTLIPMAMIVLGASPGRPLQIIGSRRPHVPPSTRILHQRTHNKIRHVVHSDNFSQGRVYGIVANPRNVRLHNLKRNILEAAFRTFQFRNKFGSKNSFVDLNRRRRMLIRPLLNLLDRKRMDVKMDVLAGEVSELEYGRAMAISTTESVMDDKVRLEADAKGRWNGFRISLFKDKSITSAISSRGGAMASTTSVASTSQQLSIRTSISTASLSTTTSTISSTSTDIWIIETPLFPIILPKSWEPPTITKEATESLEISVSLEQDTVLSKPSMQILQTATSPLIPKAAWSTFQGNELYYPESMEMLSQTGLQMALDGSTVVDWIGEKKTLKFLQDHDTPESLIQALSSTREVLAWSGKFLREGQGSELPIIKTMAVIDKSPQSLAELLMDSSKVKVYNKMSLGRSDEEVFQMGVNTVGGDFGDGESKVVRNLTKPPMVNSILEFITCMHARKLRPEDTKLIPYTSETNEPIEGYIVVSRAVTGGKWTPSSNSNENYVRNEILLGVNLLKAIPGEPDKTELTAVTHVYSPMIPLMLAKNAGMKGAVDFVRDIRAI